MLIAKICLVFPTWSIIMNIVPLPFSLVLCACACLCAGAAPRGGGRGGGAYFLV